MQTRDGGSAVLSDACVFSMRSVDSCGAEGPAKKPTRWMGNARRVMQELARRLEGHHAHHVHLVGGRAAKATPHPPETVAALIRGFHVQKADDARAR